MKTRLILLLGLCTLLKQMPAQENWADVPCYQPSRASYDAINRMFVDSLHNEIILNSIYGYSSTCNITYKGMFAYNGSSFRDLDFGLDLYNATNPFTAGNLTMGCITYNDKTLFGGTFYSVGSNTVYAKSIALWNGAKWDTFPKYVFPNDLSDRGGGINGFLKYNGELWIYGAFDTIGGIVAKNICSFDGNTFTPHGVPIPDTYNYVVSKVIAYKNKLIACGQFYDPSFTISRLAIHDGNTWTALGNGIKGSLSFVNDMVIYKDTLYIAGSWPASGGNVGNHIMKWDGAQLHDAGFGNYYGSDAISSLVVYRDRLFAFGNFGHAANQRAFGIAYYQNGAWTVPKDSIANHGARYGVVYNNDLYIAGSFKNINKDTTIRNFARLVCPDFDAASGCISGLSERTLRTRVKLFPNPVRNELKIELENSSTFYLTITNILGEILLSREEFSTSQRVDVSFLPPGVYMVNVNDGTRAFSNKFVKADR